MSVLGWLQLALIIALAGTLAGSAVSALVAGAWMTRLEGIRPRARFILLCALAFFPAFSGALALLIAFAPSVLDVLGIAADHCAHHGGHAFHLCFVHSAPPALPGALLLAGLAALLAFSAGAVRELVRQIRFRRWARQLSRLTRFDPELGVWTLACARPFAMAVGLWRPRIYVSEPMRDLLSAPQLEAVIAHERAHVRRLDSLVKNLAHLSARLHVPAVGRRLIEELHLACEQACDEAAAEVVGDRCTVAEAILAVERASVRSEAAGVLPRLALGFGAHALERRIHAMLDDDWRGPSWTTITLVSITAFGALVAFHDALHHTVETLLSHII